VQDILVTIPSYKFDSQDLNMPLKDDYVLVKIDECSMSVHNLYIIMRKDLGLLHTSNFMNLKDDNLMFK